MILFKADLNSYEYQYNFFHRQSWVAISSKIIFPQKRGRPDKTKKALVRQNENNTFSPRSSQTDSDTSKSDNSSL